ncbi:MAG TPA: hypothetical protein VGC73_03615 [Pyrinomonadaceae bacterium]
MSPRKHVVRREGRFCGLGGVMKLADVIEREQARAVLGASRDMLLSAAGSET